jgi:hypothetical protein
MDRKKGNVIISHKGVSTVNIMNNILVGDFLYAGKYIKNNSWYLSREQAKLNKYPYIPDVSELPSLINTMNVLGGQR